MKLKLALLILRFLLRTFFVFALALLPIALLLCALDSVKPGDMFRFLVVWFLATMIMYAFVHLVTVLTKYWRKK